MEFGKKLLFFVFMPPMVLLGLFVNLTYDWWMGLRVGRKVLFILLTPIYAPLAFFMFYVFPFWAKLAD